MGYSLWGCKESDTAEVTKQQQQKQMNLITGLPCSSWYEGQDVSGYRDHADS